MHELLLFSFGGICFFGGRGERLVANTDCQGVAGQIWHTMVDFRGNRSLKRGWNERSPKRGRRTPLIATIIFKKEKENTERRNVLDRKHRKSYRHIFPKS